MAIKKCNHGHFYDDVKYFTCPHCGVKLDASQPAARSKTQQLREQYTVALRSSSAGSDEQMTQAYSEADDGKTVGIYFTAQGNLVVGWLVCVSGPERGRDYRLHSGHNYLGRASGTDIYVAEDSEISRQHHLSVVYEPKQNRFLIVPEPGAIAYLNDQLLTGSRPLQDGDEIKAGQSGFIFRSFCRGDFVWKDQD